MIRQLASILTFHIPITLEAACKSAIAGESAKQALHCEYIIMQSMKSVSM